MESIGNSAESVAQAFVRAINRQDADRLAMLMALPIASSTRSAK